PARTRLDQFRVVRADGAGHDHAVGAGHVGGVVALVHLDAQALQAAGHGVVGAVRAGHGVAERAQHLGQPAHAGAADADEVDAVGGVGEVAPVLHATAQAGAHALAPVSSTAEATASAASGRASPRAACAIGSRSARSQRISSVAETRLANSFGSSPSGSRCAAPRSTRYSALRVWWSSTAAGNGTSSAPTPAAHSSASVSAPARQTTMSAHA